MAEFFAMGGYAGYVWPAFGITTIVLIGLLVISLRALRRREATLARLQGEDGSRETEA
jgi:heme exporter protein D